MIELNSKTEISRIEAYYDLGGIMGVRVDFDDGSSKWVGSTGLGALASTTLFFS
jgi:hypothetical protein